MAKILTRGFTSYPPPLSQRSGCKVGWLIYASKTEAEAAAKFAVVEASRREAEGYDFGYCAPGSITELKDGTFEVCIP